MGCDIHTFTERKPSSPQTGANKQVWECTDFFEMNKYFDPNEEDGEPQFSRVEICRNRNYNLFAVLADVRNGGTPYICDPKGIPDDCCEYINQEYERWRGDGHSHSWFTLFELKEYRNKVLKEGVKTKYSGYMNPKDAELVDKGEMPEMWWGGGNSPNQVYREWERVEDTLGSLVKELEERKKHAFGFDARVYRDAPENSVDVPQEVDKEFRFVFWFDN